MAAQCAECGAAVRTQRARYCCGACRQRAYRRRAVPEPAAADSVVLAPPDSFVGRRPELTALRRLLRDHRLVTVTGPAGAGKTRLAVELAARLGPEFRDGIRLVDLAAIGRGELAGPVVASAVGVRPDAGDEALSDALAERHLMLLLDNCEHVRAACAGLAEAITRRCPDVRILVTSREVLQVKGEQSFPLGELPAPDAIRLFAARAASAAPGFRLTEDNTGAVRQLCERLDGLPLAIELAAPWIRLLDVPDIVARLDDRLDLLASGGHGSLRAAIDRSYELLGAPEQAAWRRLSVLTGPFSPELAAAVYGDAPVLPMLASLAAKSLLTRGADGLRQLESLRLYGRERLIAAGELTATTERMVARLLATIEAHLDRFGLPPALRRELGAQWHILVSAVEWTAARSDERHAPLAYALADYWLDCGHDLADTRRLLDDALERLAGRRRDHLGLLLGMLSTVAILRGDRVEALRRAEQAVAIERTLDRPGRLAKTLDQLAYSLSCVDEPDAAWARYRESLDLVRSLDDPAALASSLNNVAWAALRFGHEDVAQRLVDEGLPLTREQDPHRSLTAMLHTAGTLALLRDELDLAEERFSEGLTIDRRNPHHIPHPLEGIAIIAVARGEAGRGLRLIECAAEIRRRAHTEREPDWGDRVDAAAAAAARLLTAREQAAAQAAGRQVGIARAADYGLSGAGAAVPGSLSEQELLIVSLVAAGLTNQHIGRRLGIAPRTVATHLERVRTKLGLRTRAELGAWFARTTE